MSSQAPRCPGCAEGDLRAFFTLDEIPVACNVLASTREEALSAARGCIRLGFCESCGLLYNTAFDPELIAYTAAYENSLHFSPRFQSYAERLADRLVERHGLDGKRILEVGCGKGEFLQLLCLDGKNRGLGFDSSYAGDDCGSEQSEIRIVRDAFSEEYADERADLVCCRQVLEHIAQPVGFVRRLADVARRSGGAPVFIEVPNALWTLRDLGIWDVIYEHCSYFTPSALRILLERSGLRVEELAEDFDGQFLRADTTPYEFSSPAVRTPAPEVEALRDLVGEFAQAFETTVERWRARLGEWARLGEEVAIWGAGSKGVTFLNVMPEGSLRCAIDVNPRKQGKFVAGAGHRIEAPSVLADTRICRVLAMNPTYLDEVKRSCHEVGFSGEVLSV